MIQSTRVLYTLMIVLFTILIVSTGCSSWQYRVQDCTKDMMKTEMNYKDAAKYCYNLHKEK
jgi:hypothetical protein